MKTSFFAAAAFIGLTTFSAQAVNLLVPSDPIKGGVLSAGTFTLGVAGTAGGVNNWPAAEPPSDMINGVIGGGNEKYLNFAKFNTGVVFTPAAGSSALISMTLWVANDAVERDPANYEIYGSNSVTITPGSTGPFTISDFTLISSGPLSLPDTRDTTPDASGFSETVNINAASAFTTYLLVFPTVKNEGIANSMQISEVQFDVTLVPEPGSALLALSGLAAVTLRRRRA